MTSNDWTVSSARGRWIAFAALCIGATGLSVLALLAARGETNAVVEGVDTVAVADIGADEALTDGEPDLVFESTALGDTYGRLAVVPVARPTTARAVSDLSCERVHFRAGRGVCLQSDRGVITTYDAVVFDAALDELHRVGLAGTPSRVRVSPGGTLAGMTVFVSGHSYADGGFSTQTTLLDLESGQVVADLEVDFAVYRDEERWQAVDFNFWGVTFVDDGHFYATLGNGGEHHLVLGDVAARRFDVVTEGVECPSLSPDGSRIAYKSRLDNGLGPVSWTISVLDLATMRSIDMAEDRSVDDQVAWLDDETIIYGVPSAVSPAVTDTWAVPADGTGAPRLLLEGGWSVAPAN